MPQGPGETYPTLSVEKTCNFLAACSATTPPSAASIDHLTHSTGLHPFWIGLQASCPGGMKQKLGLCCALIHDLIC